MINMSRLLLMTGVFISLLPFIAKTQADKQKSIGPKQEQIQTDKNKQEKNQKVEFIMYGHFECPYCGRAYDTVLSVLKKYNGQIKFSFRNVPGKIYPDAQLAARYYEAIKRQSDKKAFKFFRELFQNQSKINKGNQYFEKVAIKLGVKMKRLNYDLNVRPERVNLKLRKYKRLKKKHGKGTPIFVVEGRSIKGIWGIEKLTKLVGRAMAK